MASLRVISGPLAGERIAVERVLTIGRHDADVVIDDPELSRRHLEVRPEGDALIVEDLGSTNGTLVDNRTIDRPTQVGGGARVQLGSSIFEVEVVAQVPTSSLSRQPHAEELGVFNPPSPRRRGGLASRSWIPVALSFGSAIATAIALVVYFAQR